MSDGKKLRPVSVSYWAEETCAAAAEGSNCWVGLNPRNEANHVMIGTRSLLGSGALVPDGTVVPPTIADWGSAPGCGRGSAGRRVRPVHRK
jgi:hypothetical protein